MIDAIKELNFPAYATLSQASVVLNDMGDRTISADVKIDGSVSPDFSYDWEVEFKGEKYIHPLRKPQALKDDKSSRSTVSLTFYHWAIYQLKRDFFVELASTQAGTAFADKYVSPLAVNLGEFVTAFNNVLAYYFPDGKIYAVLNPDWEYDKERQYVDISYSYLWDVLQKTHELFNVRWSIEKDNSGNYAIRFGYPTGELTHIFEYGFEGGLLKVERQVQDTNIRNKILGRGGSRNLPYLYFKDYDKYPLGGDGNQGMIPDPDAIPELANIYFTELRDSNFRSYVQGWKTNSNRQLVEGDVLDEFDAERAETDYAYMRGATDEKFDPVEYVKDDASIAEYGELVGKLENNDEIFPSLQGMEIDITMPGGETIRTRADEVVAVQEVVTDRIASDEIEVKNDIKLEAKSETSHGAGSNTFVAAESTIQVSSNDVVVPEGYEGKLFDVPTIKYTLEWKERIKQYMQYKQYYEGDKLSGNTYSKGDDAFPSVSYKVIDAISGTEVHPVNLPEGRYRIDYTLKFPAVTLDRGIIHAQQTPTGLGQTERVSVYWLKRIVKTSAAIICKSFNGDVILNKVDGVSISKSASVAANAKTTISISGDTFSVPAQGALMVDVPISVTPAATTTYSEKTVKVVNAKTNEIVPAINIPEGEYKLLVDVTLTNESSSAKTLKVELLPAYLYFVDNTEKWEPTFDVWIKNVFNTKKSDYASEAAYVEGVWSPLRTEDDMAVTFSSGNLSGHDSWEFRIKKGGIAYDNSKVITDANGNEVRSEWRLTLIKSDAELETIKKYIPYKDFNAKAGDFFYFTGIYLPHQYILSAEQELTDYKRENLLKVSDIKPQWVISLDKVRAQQGDVEKLIDTLSTGSVITLKDKRFTKNANESRILQSITYEWQEGLLLPNVDIVLSDKVTTSLSTVAMLQGKVESLIKSVAGLSNIEQIIRKVGDTLYLRKDGFEETSYSPTKFADTVSSEDFVPGSIGGVGWAAYRDENGMSVIEADKLFVRNEMHVNSLIINQISAMGGINIISAADMKISAVESVALEDGSIGERCFFDTNGASKGNLFAVDDIAYSNMFDSENAELKYYKRRVVEVGENYITLSTTDTDGEGTPQEGDVIVQFGNFTDESRQNAIVIAAYGSNAPSIVQYKGINSFAISEDNIVTKLSSTENIFTGKVHMEIGSSISNNIIENLDERIKDAIGGIAVGKYNLLRNSGFTGDYMSLELDSNEPLDSNTEMYSDPFAYWSSKNASVQDSVEAASGKEVNLQNGSLSQELLDKIILGESYVLSFKAKGSSLEYTIGGVSDTIILNDSWAEYVYKFTASEANSVFIISNAQAVICDLQLERGNVQSSWGYSMWDNPKELTRLQSMQYLESAIRQGSTDILGGLIMSNIMMLGNPNKADNTAGISGIYNDNADVAYWSGGSFSQAISAVMKYLADPTYQPTEEELASMANFVVTHGGRAILNDAIVRGTIYAKDGVFEGEIRANRGNFGDMHIVSSETWGDAGLKGEKVYDGTETHTLELYPDYFEMSAKDTVSGTTEYKEWVRISPYYYVDRYDMEGMVELYALKGRPAIVIQQGHVRGLRHDVLTTGSDSVELSSYSPYIVILNTTTDNLKSVHLPIDAEKGTTFHIINAYRNPLSVGIDPFEQNVKIVFNIENGELGISADWNDGVNNPCKVEAYFDGNLWYICPIK